MKRILCKFMLNGLAGKVRDPSGRTTDAKKETTLPELISRISPQDHANPESSYIWGDLNILSLVATEAVAVALSSGGTPLGIWGGLTTAVSTSAGRTSILHLRLGILTWGLSWWTTITTLLGTRELAWRLLVSHRSG